MGLVSAPLPEACLLPGLAEDVGAGTPCLYPFLPCALLVWRELS